MSKLKPLLILVGISLISAAPSASAETRSTAPQVDIVIALDVSGSMTGLIDSTRQRLWDIVNELARAQPVPELKVAILSFGNPGYGPAAGYVRIDQPFTHNLDAVSRTLFAFQTDGGDEYVARAVDTAVRSLQWSEAPDALRILFVAGNESAFQDPQIAIEHATGAAAARGIVVNTIYCGGEQDGVAAEWRRVAELTNGIFASIDQNAAAVAGIATPMDGELASLNEALNDTYIPYGRDGLRNQETQLDQDRNAAGMSRQALASRAFTKASRFYSNADWDLVDAVAAGRELDDIADEELPEVMRSMDRDARQEYVAAKSGERDEIKQQIAALDADRRAYIAERQSALSASGGLDQALLAALRQQARDKGFELAVGGIEIQGP